MERSPALSAGRCEAHQVPSALLTKLPTKKNPSCAIFIRIQAIVTLHHDSSKLNHTKTMQPQRFLTREDSQRTRWSATPVSAVVGHDSASSGARHERESSAAPVAHTTCMRERQERVLVVPPRPSAPQAAIFGSRAPGPISDK